MYLKTMKNCTSIIFCALKPCIDGFLEACRPYLSIDVQHLMEDGMII
jgi:hypothetical protein